MIEPAALLIFMTATFILLITPGPAVLFIIARSLEQGRGAGIVSAVGVGAGSIIHVIVAAAGLSMLLVQSAIAFSVVKYLGAAYLIYLGIRTLLSKTTATVAAEFKPTPLRRIFGQGFVVQLFNPKTALFFLAFLPQFVDPNGGHVTSQIVFLGAIFVGMAILSDSVYAVVAGSVRGWLAGNQRWADFQKKFAGTVYIGLGVTTALSGRKV